MHKWPILIFLFTCYSLLLLISGIIIGYHTFYSNISGSLMAALHACYAMFVHWGNNCQNKQILILVCQIIWEANIHLGMSHWVQTETSCLVENYACNVIEISNTGLRQSLSQFWWQVNFPFYLTSTLHETLIWFENEKYIKINIFRKGTIVNAKRLNSESIKKLNAKIENNKTTMFIGSWEFEQFEGWCMWKLKIMFLTILNNIQ